MNDIEGKELPEKIDAEMIRLRDLTENCTATLNAALRWHADQISILRQENDAMWADVFLHFDISKEDEDKWYARWDRDTKKYHMRERGLDNPLREKE